MGRLADEIQEHETGIRSHLHIGYAIWDDLITRVEAQEARPTKDFYDEQIWTFLVGCAYAYGDGGVAHLAQMLVGEEPPLSAKIWFECLPYSPRDKEGKTRVDLAFGAIRLRSGTQSGIEFERAAGTRSAVNWVALCECKWYSDIDIKVSYDVHRNQLLRTVENAACFQESGGFPERVHVVLITPAAFKQRAIKSRLYQYKMAEYTSDPQMMLDELNACRLKPAAYCPTNLDARIRCLQLHWATYQELLQEAPKSALQEPLREFTSFSDGSGEHC